MVWARQEQGSKRGAFSVTADQFADKIVIDSISMYSKTLQQQSLSYSYRVSCNQPNEGRCLILM